MSLFTAHSQRFRVLSTEAELEQMQRQRDVVKECRDRLLHNQTLEFFNISVRPCPCCGCLLLESEPDYFCCGDGSRLHHSWVVLPQSFNNVKFHTFARVINCCLSPVVIHGSTGEGVNHRRLSYQRSVMTLSGTLYNRAIRDHKNCWFLHDSQFDERMTQFLKTKASKKMLKTFATLLKERNTLFTPDVSSMPLMQDSQVFMEISEETRMCSVFVYDGSRTEFAPSRSMVLLQSGQTIDELNPAWELFAYPIMHFTGDATRVWDIGYRSTGGQKMSLLQYARSVIMNQVGFWRYGRLAEQWVLDMWARQEQVNMRHWRSKDFQQKLRNHAFACNRSVPPDKVFLPSSIPGSYVYQRRYFHDVLHIAKMLGNSHLFITFTCNANWPEIKALFGGGPVDMNSESHQVDIARVFVHKRKQLIAKLGEKNYLFDGHLGVQWLVYSTEWQKGDLPHAHLACRLDIDTDKQPMATRMDQIRLMEKVVCARKPDVTAKHYDHVMYFMQHPNPCKSCMQPVRGTSEKRCRFRFPKQTCSQTRIDAKGFPVYQRGPEDVRIVPYNARLLIDFCCHINVEWTFNSLHFAYLYSYMCKGVDTAGFRIRDMVDEITAFRKARIFTVAECIYRTLGFNVNYRSPAVVVCPIHLPRGRMVSAGENDVAMGLSEFAPVVDGNDDFGDNEMNEVQLGAVVRHTQFPEDFGVDDEDFRAAAAASMVFKLDFLEHYFQTGIEGSRPEDMKFCEYYARYRLDTPLGFWVCRSEPILARMQWYPPTAGPIYYLRTLLWAISANSWEDLFGGYRTFRDHCVALGLVADGAEYLHGLRDAMECGHSPTSLRHLFATFITSVDAKNLKDIWANKKLRHYMSSDFFDDLELDNEGMMNTEDNAFADKLALMDIASTVNGMGGGADFTMLFGENELPLPPHVSELPAMHNFLPVQYMHVFNRYAAVVGYSIRQRVVVEGDQKEIIRFQETTTLLTDAEMDAAELSLNSDQRVVFDELLQTFNLHKMGIPNTPNLFSVNASGGCGKTFMIRVFLHAVRRLGVVTASVSSIGIGALQFDDGQTVHSMFRIPIHEETDVLQGDKLTSKLIKTLDDGYPSQRIAFLRACEVIVWDEISPIRHTVFHAVDVLFRRIHNKPNVPFGGTFFVFLGDWKQIPPVDDSTERTRFWDGDPIAFESIFFLSVKSTSLWHHFVQKRYLKINERAKFDIAFQRDLHAIGNGHWNGEIPIDKFGFQVFTTLANAMHWLYVQGEGEPYDPKLIAQKAVMSPYNEAVDEVNDLYELECVRLKGADVVSLLSVDEFVGGNPPEEDLKEPEDVRSALNREAFRQEEENLRADTGAEVHDVPALDSDNEENIFDMGEALGRVSLEKDTFNLEILHGMTFHGVPPHKLRLYRGQCVILLRNLDAKNRLQNGVRLIIKDFLRGFRVIAVVRADDVVKGLPNPPIFLLPRITFEGKMTSSRETMVTRRQFPVRACAAVSIHKCQSMTLLQGVIDVRDGVFEHGQLFVAASRCRMRGAVAFLANPGQTTVRNIVLRSFIDDDE